MNPLKLSKEISYALRHAPWEYELELDEQGFVPIEQLLHALNESGSYEREVTLTDLEQIIASSEKKRHEIVGDKIRALYGHTIPQTIKKEPGIPPAILFHGTTHKALPQIFRDGLKPMKRQYVHLSIDTDTAARVGNDKVWLCRKMPKEFLLVSGQ